MKHRCCYGCADRVLYCKTWCERWAKEVAENDAEKAEREKFKKGLNEWYDYREQVKKNIKNKPRIRKRDES